MLRLKSLVQRTALVATGVTIGAVLWKSRSGAGANSPDAGPLRQSVIGLEDRLAALENAERRTPSVDAAHNPAETVAAIASLEATVASLTARYDDRMSKLESRVGAHDAKLKEVPTLAQVVTTMEEMLANTMSGLDQKLSDQVRSIETLKTTVSQSDELMERVLDSIYSLQSHVADNDKSEVPVSV